MEKKAQPRKTRKHSFRFTKADQDSVKAVLRPRFKDTYDQFLNSEKNTREEIPAAAARVVPYLGNDWRLVDDPDDQHPVIFPLRRDIRIEHVRNAVEALFPDEADTLRRNIVAYIEQANEEKRAWKREGEKWARTVAGRDGFIAHAWRLFGVGHLSGENLYRELTPDAQSQSRWDKNLRLTRMKMDQLRATPSFAAKVVSELLHELCGVPKKDIDDQKLKKRFQAMPLN